MTLQEMVARAVENELAWHPSLTLQESVQSITAAALTAIQREHVIVPRKPTEEMIEAGRAATVARLSIPGSALTVAREKMRRRYTAMIAAAPPLE
jgi:hypothetical protein